MSGLAEELEHDYSCAEDGVVPLDRRRSRSAFTALWISLSGGFTSLAIGFEFHYYAWSLARTTLAAVLAALCYLAYALPAAYLGSSTGQTHALLTRSIFGRVGSVLVSLFLIALGVYRVAYSCLLLAMIGDQLFGWGHLVLISVVLAVLGVAGATFGFAGLIAYAKYLAAPLMILWLAVLVVKGAHDLPVHHQAALAIVSYTPIGPSLPVAISLALTGVVWGNEPDFWRYGRPSFTWPLLPYALALLVGPVLLIAGGWLVADVAGSGPDDLFGGGEYRAVAKYTLFGLLWLAGVLVTVWHFAINGGNYYQVVNAGQNLLGQVRGWRRLYTCVLAAVVTAILAAVLARLWTSSLTAEVDFARAAALLAIVVPCATVVMVADRFVLARFGRRRRRVEPVPAWTRAARTNGPAVVAVAVAGLFGAWSLSLFPHERRPDHGLLAPEAWVLAGVLYLALAALDPRTRRRRHRPPPPPSVEPASAE